MSTDEEIREVFEQDIAEKERIVLNKHGILAFLDKEGVQIHELLEGVVSEDDRELLQRILDGDVDGD